MIQATGVDHVVLMSMTCSARRSFTPKSLV